MNPDDDFFKEKIDLIALTPEEFEKLVYYLLDEIGMKNIEWRKGGIGISSSDGGRDLECEFHIITPDGSIRIEKWWFEVKHRTTTLESSKVKEIIINAYAFTGIDVIGIITNNVISNPTKDWIADFRKTHPDKKVITWEGHHIENIIYMNQINNVLYD